MEQSCIIQYVIGALGVNKIRKRNGCTKMQTKTMSRSIYSEWLNYSRHGCMILNIHPQAPLSHPRRRKEYPHSDSPSRSPHIGERGYWNRRLQEKNERIE